MLRNDLEDSIDVNNLARVLRRIAQARHPDATIALEDCRTWIESGLGYVVPDICGAAMTDTRQTIGAEDDVFSFLESLRRLESQERVP